jgi:hypothetical protein
MMKLIREFDDFDWVRDIQPMGYNDLKGKALHFLPPINNNSDLNRIIKYLTDLGFTTGEFLRGNFDFDGESIEGLYIDNNDHIIWTGDLYGNEDYQDHINDYASREVEVLDGWDLFSGLITESKDEWSWVRDEPIRPTSEFPPKKGDVLICLPGFNNTDHEKFGGGSGYEEGRIIVVGSTEEHNDGLIIWPNDWLSKQYWYQEMECFDCGIWDRALAYYNK